ncbi:uracil DNA N-glycosylase Thp1 [Lithohypha guttulata]|uniref:uracil DNA N-glycosylase Thp1 n=1 Tax=Lithohypha guttulata TaxID=1690604 RepID=UPI00315C7814
MLVTDSNHSELRDRSKAEPSAVIKNNLNAQDQQTSDFKQKLQQFGFRLETSAMAPRTRQSVAASPSQKLTSKVVKNASASNSDVTSKVRIDGSESATKAALSNSRKRKRAMKNVESPTVKGSAMNPVNNLKDSLEEGLILVSIGVNPGIMTGLTGEAYSHPSNRYWPTLYASGITPVPHKPKDTHSLMDLYGLGHTNVVAHIASRAASDLTKEDWMVGARDLDEKIRKFKPEAVCLVGEGIFTQWFRYKEGRPHNVKKDGPVKFGIQDEKYWIGRKEGEYKGSTTWVVTTTSGASTKHSTQERVAIWKPLGDWFAPKRDQWIKERKGQEETADVI